MAAYFITNFTSGKYYPVNNPINITVNSANSGNCNFRYVARIFINNTFVFSSKLFPDPTTGYGFFQIDRILQDWITNTIPKTPYTAFFNIAASTTIPTALQSVYVKIGEEYDSSVNCDGTVYSYLDQVTSNTFYAYNGAFGYEEFLSYNDSDYILSGASTTKKFLTNQPRTKEVTFNDSEYLDFLTNSTVNSTFQIVITRYDLSGVVDNITVPAGSPTLTGVKRYRIAVGPFDLNKILASNYITSSTSKYEIYISVSSIQVSETMTYKVKAPKPFETRLAWINQLGGIDHFTFYHRNNKSYDIVRKTFKKSLQSNYASNWTYQVGDRQDTTYNIAVNEKHSVSTYCGRLESAWLNELYFSLDVWTYNYDACETITTWKMLPVVVTNTAVKEEQRISKPIMYSIDYEMAFNKNVITG